MKISDIILIVLIAILVAIGFSESGGNPRLPTGIITWPIAFFMLIIWTIKRLSDKSVLASLGLALLGYLMVGILFGIWQVATLPNYVPGAGPSIPVAFIYSMFVWPAFLFELLSLI